MYSEQQISFTTITIVIVMYCQCNLQGRNTIVSGVLTANSHIAALWLHCTIVRTMVKLRGGNQCESSSRLHPQLFPVQLFNDDLCLGLLLLILPDKVRPKASRVNHSLLRLPPPGISK